MAGKTDFHLTESLPYLIGRLGLYLNDAIEIHLAEESLNVPQWRVLGVLYKQPSYSMRELADAAAVTLTALSRVVGELERRGLAERRRSKRDARIVEVVLTTLGRATVRRVLPHSRALEERIVRALTDESASALRLALQRVYAALMTDIAETK